MQQSIQLLVDGKDLAQDEISACVREMAEGAATPAQMGAFLVALREKGETVDEIAAFASALRSYSLQIKPSVKGRLVDTCGTGGDMLKTFNVSTVSALVAAGAGAKVAKHGNRSVTSRCGSADLLERLGFDVNMEPSRVKDSIEKIGIGFMFAPSFHPAMKRVAPVRKELGIRTVFNLMGPLINPAGVGAQVLGVYSPELVPRVAQVLERLGTEEAMVVHGLEGMDEISVTGRTVISWLRNGEITTREYSPRDFGVKGGDASTAVSGPDESAKMALIILSGSPERSGLSEMVVVNSAAALVVSGRADGFPDGMETAKQSIDAGAAYRKLEELVRFSGGDLTRIELNAANK